MKYYIEDRNCIDEQVIYTALSKLNPDEDVLVLKDRGWFAAEEIAEEMAPRLGIAIEKEHYPEGEALL